ncbi:MAG TPA: L-histidine N(alpha)-methyltransferase [Burkholderiaceae bacterium]
MALTAVPLRPRCANPLPARTRRQDAAGELPAPAGLPRPAAAPICRISKKFAANLAAERDACLAGLLERPARIEPKHFYDAVGCALFEAICGLPEYYLTRTEARIFERHREEIMRELPERPQWVDLGCGNCAKSEPWLNAVGASRFIGVDIASEWLEQALAAVAPRFPGVECIGVSTDFSGGVDLADTIGERPGEPPVFFYPGSSLGNFTSEAAMVLLRSIRAQLGGDGCLLIGVDLVKDTGVLEAAYDDALGVTGAFNRNILRAMNRLLGADFDPAGFAHRAFFDPAGSRIEMHLVANRSQSVRLGAETRRFDAGEAILTEYSHKYTIGGFARMLSDAGFGRQKVWTDDAAWFGVFLART